MFSHITGCFEIPEKSGREAAKMINKAVSYKRVLCF